MKYNRHLPEPPQSTRSFCPRSRARGGESEGSAIEGGVGGSSNEDCTSPSHGKSLKVTESSDYSDRPPWDCTSPRDCTSPSDTTSPRRPKRVSRGHSPARTLGGASNESAEGSTTPRTRSKTPPDSPFNRAPPRLSSPRTASWTETACSLRGGSGEYRLYFLFAPAWEGAHFTNAAHAWTWPCPLDHLLRGIRSPHFVPGPSAHCDCGLQIWALGRVHLRLRRGGVGRKGTVLCYAMQG